MTGHIDVSGGGEVEVKGVSPTPREPRHITVFDVPCHLYPRAVQGHGVVTMDRDPPHKGVMTRGEYWGAGVMLPGT